MRVGQCDHFRDRKDGFSRRDISAATDRVRLLSGDDPGAILSFGGAPPDVAWKTLTGSIPDAQTRSMKNPSRWRSIVLGVAAGIFLACSLAAKETETTPAKPATDTRAPHLLLANVWDASIDPTGWWMSEKYDGLRGYWDGGKLWTRQGNLIHAPDYFLAELPRDIALDGELWIGHGRFEETVSTVRAQNPDDRWQRVQFMVFDAPVAKGAFEERMRFLHATLPEGNRFVRVVVQERCQSVKHLLAERDRVIKMGGEGLMLRQPQSPYEAGRSPTLLKVKPYDDAEASVIGYESGKGKFAGKVGALRVRTDDGSTLAFNTFVQTQQFRSTFSTQALDRT